VPRARINRAERHLGGAPIGEDSHQAARVEIGLTALLRKQRDTETGQGDLLQHVDVIRDQARADLDLDASRCVLELPRSAR
jgi:hypothetical protein